MWILNKIIILLLRNVIWNDFNEYKYPKRILKLLEKKKDCQQNLLLLTMLKLLRYSCVFWLRFTNRINCHFNEDFDLFWHTPQENIAAFSLFLLRCLEKISLFWVEIFNKHSNFNLFYVRKLSQIILYCNFKKISLCYLLCRKAKKNASLI